MVPLQLVAGTKRRFTMTQDLYKEVDGVLVNRTYNDEDVRSVLAYKPRPGDVFITSYPKCGTTWMQYIVYNILTDAMGYEDKLDFYLRMPFLEKQGAQAAIYGRKPGAFKTHLPFGKQPYSESAKYIYITRNPYDCCVSYYYHHKHFPTFEAGDTSFDEFFPLFLEGTLTFGDYFDHVLSWYEHRNDPNVLFVTYEDLKKDTKSGIIRVAEFLGEEYKKRICEDPVLLNRIQEMCTLRRLKENVNVAYKTSWEELTASLRLDDVDPRLRSRLQAGATLSEKPLTGDFVRRGIVGDWKNHFSDGHIRRMKERIAEKNEGSDFMSLWSEEHLP